MSTVGEYWRVQVMGEAGREIGRGTFLQARQMAAYLNGLRLARGWKPEAWKVLPGGTWACVVKREPDERVYVQHWLGKPVRNGK